MKKVTTNNGTYYYSDFKWNLAWFTVFLIGVFIGCWIMWLTHKDSIQHYNVCQESQLLDSISRIGDEKSWYVKEDAFGKIKLVQLSNHQIDSLNHK